MDGEWGTQSNKRNKQQKAFVPQASNSGGKDKARNAFREKARADSRSQFDEWRRAGGGDFDNLEKTFCLMYYLDSAGELQSVLHTSGYPEGMKGKLAGLRSAAKVGQKDTVCAEERLLCTVTVPKEDLLFSAAFDSMGPKPACPNCKLCLKLYGIEDLY